MVQSHFNVLKEAIGTDITIEMYRKAWTKVYTKVQKPISKTLRRILHASTGPIYNTISMLLAIDWDPIFPDLWKHKGETYVYDSKASIKLITKYVIDTLNDLGMHSVEHHYCGKGSAAGISIDHSLSLHS